jgi:hypothetical protein
MERPAVGPIMSLARVLVNRIFVALKSLQSAGLTARRTAKEKERRGPESVTDSSIFGILDRSC